MEFDDSVRSPEKPSLESTLELLEAQDPGAVSASIYYGLSDLSQAEIDRVQSVWQMLTSDYRLKVMQELTEASESNYELEYSAMGFLGLNDDDAAVREAAIELLWYDESVEMMTRLLNMAEWDESNAVRAAAVSALGRFLLLGEYDEISEAQNSQIQDMVANLLMDEQEEVEVRRRALEAIANSSHEIVTDAIEEAYHGDDRFMRVSAVFAMGRTCDERWRDTILRELNSSDPELRYEAARAAGEIGLSEAVPLLGKLAVEPDRETQEAAIWSLGEIGGSEAMHILSTLAERSQESDDDELIEAIDDAISSASLVGGELDFDLYDFDADDEGDDE